MTLFLQQIVGGIAVGMVYGGLALAIVVVFQGTAVLNFSQGALAALSAYASWQLVGWGMAPWASFFVIVPASFVLGAVVERVLIRPVESAPELSILMVTIAIFTGVTAIIGMVWGYYPKTPDSLFGEGVVHLGGVVVTAQQIGMVGAMLVALGLVSALFRFTVLGLRLRAVALNRESSQLLGISTGRHLMIAWGLAASIGAVAGMLAAPTITLTPNSFDFVTILAFAGATLGGYFSRAGAILGGLVVGVSASLTGTYVDFIGSQLKLAVPFVIILVVLLCKPEGLFGKVAVRRA